MELCGAAVEVLLEAVVVTIVISITININGIILDVIIIVIIVVIVVVVVGARLLKLEIAVLGRIHFIHGRLQILSEVLTLAPMHLIVADDARQELREPIVIVAKNAWWVTVASRKVGDGPTRKHDVGRLKDCAI